MHAALRACTHEPFFALCEFIIMHVYILAHLQAPWPSLRFYPSQRAGRNLARSARTALPPPHRTSSEPPQRAASTANPPRLDIGSTPPPSTPYRSGSDPEPIRGPWIDTGWTLNRRRVGTQGAPKMDPGSTLNRRRGTPENGPRENEGARSGAHAHAPKTASARLRARDCICATARRRMQVSPQARTSALGDGVDCASVRGLVVQSWTHFVAALHVKQDEP